MSLLNIPFTFGFGVYHMSQVLRSSLQTAHNEMYRFFLRKCTFHLSSVCSVCSSPHDSKIWSYPETKRLLTENRSLYNPSHPPALWFWGELAAGHQVHNLKLFRLCGDVSESATVLALVTSHRASLLYNSDYGWETLQKGLKKTLDQCHWLECSSRSHCPWSWTRDAFRAYKGQGHYWTFLLKGIPMSSKLTKWAKRTFDKVKQLVSGQRLMSESKLE